MQAKLGKDLWKGGLEPRARGVPGAGQAVASRPPRLGPTLSPSTEPLVARWPSPASCVGDDERMEPPGTEHKELTEAPQAEGPLSPVEEVQVEIRLAVRAPNPVELGGLLTTRGVQPRSRVSDGLVGHILRGEEKPLCPR